MGSLTGKVAWVTGAGSGIGQAAAIALARDGATVVLTGRRRAPLEETAAMIAEAGGKAEVKPADLMKSSAVEKTVAAIAKKHRRIDILVNNAGLNIQKRSWKQLTPKGVGIDPEDPTAEDWAKIRGEVQALLHPPTPTPTTAP